MLVTALEWGIPPSEFWSMTPSEYLAIAYHKWLNSDAGRRHMARKRWQEMATLTDEEWKALHGLA